MPLPWVRVDTNIPAHDKILGLLADPSPARWQACCSYLFSIAWSGGAGTDGRIPTSALPFIHGTTATARLLVKHGLWEERTAAWQIHNYGEFQQLEKVTLAKSEQASRAARIRWHGPNGAQP